MNPTNFISQTAAQSAQRRTVNPGLRLALREEVPAKLNNKGGIWAVDAVYTNSPTQLQDMRAFGRSATARGNCGKRNTHGVRTNG